MTPTIRSSGLEWLTSQSVCGHCLRRRAMSLEIFILSVIPRGLWRGISRLESSGDPLPETAGDDKLVSSFLQPVRHFRKRQSIDDVVFGEPAFARDSDAEGNELELLHTVRVRVDAELNALFLGQRQHAPVNVKPLGLGIAFDTNTLGGGDRQHFPLIHRIGLSFEQK